MQDGLYIITKVLSRNKGLKEIAGFAKSIDLIEKCELDLISAKCDGTSPNQKNNHNYNSYHITTKLKHLTKIEDL